MVIQLSKFFFIFLMHVFTQSIVKCTPRGSCIALRPFSVIHLFAEYIPTYDESWAITLHRWNHNANVPTGECSRFAQWPKTLYACRVLFHRWFEGSSGSHHQWMWGKTNLALKHTHVGLENDLCIIVLIQILYTHVDKPAAWKLILIHKYSIRVQVQMPHEHIYSREWLFNDDRVGLMTCKWEIGLTCTWVVSGDLVRVLKLYKSQTHVEPEEASKSNYAAAVII